MQSFFEGAEIISVYTREQAIEDGVLIDVTETAVEAGFRVPVAVTAAVWADCVAWSDDDSKRQVYQDESGRLWDTLFMAGFAARSRPDSSELVYEFYRVPRGGRGRRARLRQLKLHIGPGDHGEAVATIMLPHED